MQNWAVTSFERREFGVASLRGVADVARLQVDTVLTQAQMPSRCE